MTVKRKDIEMMAPVGCMESLHAAINAGADAIYFGVGVLNMRAKSAVNFTLDDLANIVQIAHAVGVKTYLTVNTILYDNEMEAVREVIDRALSILSTLEIPEERTVYLKEFAENLMGREK